MINIVRCLTFIPLFVTANAMANIHCAQVFRASAPAGVQFAARIGDKSLSVDILQFIEELYSQRLLSLAEIEVFADKVQEAIDRGTVERDAVDSDAITREAINSDDTSGNSSQRFALNPISLGLGVTHSNAHIYRLAFNRLVSAGHPDWELMLEGVNKLIRNEKRQNIDRTDVESAIATNPQGQFFQRIEPGTVTYKDTKTGKEETITIDYPFEVMITPVTQKHWAEVMGANPSHHAGDPSEARTIVVRGHPINITQDFPVENVSWWDAVVYANEFSRLKSLPAVYDLGSIKFYVVNSQSLSFQDVSNRDRLFEIAASGGLAAMDAEAYPDISTHSGDVHDAPGYRLMTLNEYRYLLVRTGIYEMMSGESPDGIKLSEYEMFLRSTVAEVASRRPYDKYPLFDLIGNVNVWGHDKERYGILKSTFVNRKKEETYERTWARKVFGSNEFEITSKFNDLFGNISPANQISSKRGIRLARTLLPNSKAPSGTMD